MSLVLKDVTYVVEPKCVCVVYICRMLVLPTCVCHIRHHRSTYVAFLATLTYVVRRYYLGTIVSEVFVYHCHIIMWSPKLL